jgi:hypothetical protein
MINKIIALMTLIGFAIYIISNTVAKPNQEKRTVINQCILLLNSKLHNKNKSYIPDKKAYNRFINDYLNNMNLNAMAYDILKHCGLRPASLYVTTTEEFPEQAAGVYKIQGSQSTIEVKIRPYIRADEVLAVLIHECMHFYLRYKNIGYNDTYQNEMLTDVTTIYMGFYEQIIKGYTRTGYVKRNEIRYIKSTIEKITKYK